MTFRVYNSTFARQKMSCSEQLRRLCRQLKRRTSRQIEVASERREQAVELNQMTVIGQTYQAFMFDMDGTLLSSIASAERAWSVWARKQGLDVEKFLPTIHGARSVDTIRRLNLPGLDPAAEAAAITRAEIEDLEGISEISGAISFLKSLPPQRWAIVTSAPKELAKARLQSVGMPIPQIMVTAEDVKEGKPNPACYQLGAQRLGFDVKDCLVFEDAEVGISAGETAGCGVLVITATHAHPVKTIWQTIRDYKSLKLNVTETGGLVLSRSEV